MKDRQIKVSFFFFLLLLPSFLPLLQNCQNTKCTLYAIICSVLWLANFFFKVADRPNSLWVCESVLHKNLKSAFSVQKSQYYNNNLSKFTLHTPKTKMWVCCRNSIQSIPSQYIVLQPQKSTISSKALFHSWKVTKKLQHLYHQHATLIVRLSDGFH